MEPVALPYLSGLMSDVMLGMFFALCGFAGLCAFVLGAWRMLRTLRRWWRRRHIRWDLLDAPEPTFPARPTAYSLGWTQRNVQPTPATKGEVWIGCGCDWCAGAPARAANRA